MMQGISNKLSSRNEGEIKTLPDKQKLSKFITRLVLQEMLKVVLQVEIKDAREQHDSM